MIISMKLGATKEQIDHIRQRIEEFGYRVHSIAGEERVVIAAVGVGDVTRCLEIRWVQRRGGERGSHFSAL